MRRFTFLVLFLFAITTSALALEPKTRVAILESLPAIVGVTETTYHFDGTLTYWELHGLCNDEVKEGSHWCSAYSAQNGRIDPNLPPGKYWVRSSDRNFTDTFRNNCNGFDGVSQGRMWTVDDRGKLDLEICNDETRDFAFLCCIEDIRAPMN